MTPQERAHISRFINNAPLSNAVYEVLFRAFTRRREHKDVYMTAAERIAIDLLGEAWQEIEGLRSVKNEPEEHSTPHL